MLSQNCRNDIDDEANNKDDQHDDNDNEDFGVDPEFELVDEVGPREKFCSSNNNFKIPKYGS